ncbi:GNAT family N-acetyltransferase [Tumebacillus algifaecis]|uniref:GNAT family N-acetyltransferase n=1 Tax=Tumebacillus algifaecis TaxID=1214604 RepID=A0A223CY35_9BACL|nr:GNAT family N-acetyltransferase [Tumebacillus algifaecis]ASS74232.1 GNAT family N-acetyltransferase [Tumebacillus algifaecis]
MIHVPEKFETKRLLIRAPKDQDAQPLYEAICESYELLKPWMPWAQQKPILAETQANIRKARQQFYDREDLRLHLFEKETGALIGCSGLHRLDWKLRKFEIGYWVRATCVGRGLITEAVAGITEFASQKLDANRIEIRTHPDNVRSIKVAERLGFTREGVLRRDHFDMQGELCDTIVFAKVRGVEF